MRGECMKHMPQVRLSERSEGTCFVSRREGRRWSIRM